MYTCVGVQGAPISYANIGEPVWHKWTCDTDTTNVFCMTVHSCKVDDGHGDTFLLLDEKGWVNGVARTHTHTSVAGARRTAISLVTLSTSPI